MKKNNDINYIKESLINEIKALRNVSNDKLSNEVAKCNAISNASLTYIKAENLNIRVKELEHKGILLEK